MVSADATFAALGVDASRRIIDSSAGASGCPSDRIATITRRTLAKYGCGSTSTNIGAMLTDAGAAERHGNAKSSADLTLAASTSRRVSDQPNPAGVGRFISDSWSSTMQPKEQLRGRTTPMSR